MSISRSDVERIAGLARLELTEAEIARLTGDLGAMLDYVKKIEALPAADEERDEAPTPFREDVVIPSLPVAEALRASADHDEAFFRVPPVIDREDA